MAERVYKLYGENHLQSVVIHSAQVYDINLGGQWEATFGFVFDKYGQYKILVLLQQKIFEFEISCKLQSYAIAIGFVKLYNFMLHLCTLKSC